MVEIKPKSALETAYEHGKGPEIPRSLKSAVIEEQLQQQRRLNENQKKAA